VLKESKYLRQEAPELIKEAQNIIRELKTTEAGQLQLIQKVVNFNELPIEKIQRIVQRAQG
jgi:hypothetical protein